MCINMYINAECVSYKRDSRNGNFLTQWKTIAENRVCQRQETRDRFQSPFEMAVLRLQIVGFNNQFHHNIDYFYFLRFTFPKSLKYSVYLQVWIDWYGLRHNILYMPMICDSNCNVNNEKWNFLYNNIVYKTEKLKS